MKNENGFNPAYPYHIKLQNSDSEKPFAQYVSHGLTKRELIAALAMQGQLAFSPHDSFNKYKTPEEVASVAVKYSDALLAELSKERE